MSPQAGQSVLRHELIDLARERDELVDMSNSRAAPA
jgi:hypothetical protein